jgi:hypothetical protein
MSACDEIVRRSPLLNAAQIYRGNAPTKLVRFDEAAANRATRHSQFILTMLSLN